MKTLILMLAFIVGIHANATNNVSVQYHSEVVTALNANDYNANVAAVHHNDLVSNLKAGYGNQVRFVVVAEPQHCSYNNVVAKVQGCQVVVKKNALQQAGLSGYNQSVVSCVQTKVVNQKVVSRRVLRRNRIVGFLTGRNARVVKVAVQTCH